MTVTVAPGEGVNEVIHGVTVRDPYRWLENSNAPETKDWLLAQRSGCTAYFSECSNLDEIRRRVNEHLDVEIVDQPAVVAGRQFYRRRNRGHEQGSLYVRDIASGEERLLVDPSNQGVFVSVNLYCISQDASLLAYGLRRGGEDKQAIKVIDVQTGLDLPVTIAAGYARGFSFMSDCSGFYYCHDTSDSSTEHTIRARIFHEPTDKIIYRAPRSKGTCLILLADEVNLGALWIRDQEAGRIADFFMAKRQIPSEWKAIFRNKAQPYSPNLKHGRIFILSFEDAPNGTVIEVDEEGEVIGTAVPRQDANIQQLVFTRGHIFVSYSDRRGPTVCSWSLSGKAMRKISTPIGGTITLIHNRNEMACSLFYTFESFGCPPVVYEYSVETQQSRMWHQRQSPAAHSPHHTRQVLVVSRDGTSIPVTLVARQLRSLDDHTPVLMTAYGGFGVAMTPQFSALVSIMMDCGVVFALPQIRGGGEFGKCWHDAARGHKRQNAFDDFIAAAEHLCATERGPRRKLAIFGASNAGLLVGVALTQRPDLFCAGLCIGPLLDMVRYEQFDQATKWRPEYGTVSDVRDFRALYGYSPYHHVAEDIDYPPVLFVSGDKDDRCNPAHARKMAATLQRRAAQIRPILLDNSEERGHSPALPLLVRIEALTRRVAFLCRELNIAVNVRGLYEIAHS
jgi:prolyl oligopeptidase